MVLRTALIAAEIVRWPPAAGFSMSARTARAHAVASRRPAATLARVSAFTGLTAHAEGTRLGIFGLSARFFEIDFVQLFILFFVKAEQ